MKKKLIVYVLIMSILCYLVKFWVFVFEVEIIVIFYKFDNFLIGWGCGFPIKYLEF